MVIKDPVPTGPRVLIQRMTPSNEGTLALPEEHYEKQQAQIGQVLVTGKLEKLSLLPGEVVVFNRGAGLNVSHLFPGKRNLIVLNEHDVIATLTVSELELAGP